MFEKWLKRLKDFTAKAIIRRRIKRLADGSRGDYRFLGDISELRIDFGPGYRVYYQERGREVIILLCGGDKSTQENDIAKARKITCDFDPEEHNEN